MNGVFLMKIMVCTAVSVFITGMVGMVNPYVIGNYFVSLWNRTRRSIKDRMERKAREAQWPEALLLVAGSLRAGLPLNDALDALLESVPEPLRSEWRNKAGSDWARRPIPVKIEILFNAPQLSLARSALLSCLESGGRAPTLLSLAASRLRRRRELADRMRTLTAQARMSAWVVGLFPVILFCAISLLSPEFVRPLWSTKEGGLILSAIFLLDLAGLYFVHKLAQVDP